MKIDFLITIYRNYELMYLQVIQFKKLFDKSEYRLIFIENTPPQYKEPIDYNKLDANCLVIYNHEPNHNFDGESHGAAIDYGRKYCTSKIVCIMDSDFFLVDPKLLKYVRRETYVNWSTFTQTQAIGAEYYDGGEPNTTNCWTEIRRFHESNFTNIPCCLCMFMTKGLLNSDSWSISEAEVGSGRHEGFVETGFKIRKYILANKIKTKAWKGSQPIETMGRDLPTYFSWNNNIVGFHYQRGSHRKMESASTDIKIILERLDYQLVK